MVVSGGCTTDVSDPDPEWVQMLVHAGLDQQMVTMLRGSPAGTFSLLVLRVGAMVNVCNIHSLHLAEQLVATDVPVYVNWGVESSWRIHVPDGVAVAALFPAE